MKLGTVLAASGLAAALAVASVALAQAGRTPVEVRRRGEDGRATIVEQAIESAFARSTDFRLARPPERSTMTVWLIEPARSTSGRRIEMQVAFGAGNHVFGRAHIACPSGRWTLCGEAVVARAKDHRHAAERRRRDADRHGRR